MTLATKIFWPLQIVFRRRSSEWFEEADHFLRWAISSSEILAAGPFRKGSRSPRQHPLRSKGEGKLIQCSTRHERLRL